MSFKTNDGLIAPVSTLELSEFARLDIDDPTLQGSLLSATQLVISYLKQDLITREYLLKLVEWPIASKTNFYHLSRPSSIYKLDIDLPMANIQEVIEVKVYDEVETEFTLYSEKQAFIRFDTAYLDNNLKVNAIEVKYLAGFGYSVNDIPEPIKQGVLMAAAYINLHRGCNATDALKMSGAYHLLVPFAVNAGFVI